MVSIIKANSGKGRNGEKVSTLGSTVILTEEPFKLILEMAWGFMSGETVASIEGSGDLIV